ncbi:MAG: hypothetical protein PHX83_15665 [Acidobacteriia bacterium]|nr:hypothetical protein [Terriglobia bacterium]
MRRTFKIVFIFIASACLAASSPVSICSQSKTVGTDGIACVGNVMQPPPGLVETENPALLAEARGASGEGKLCAGKVFRVTHPLTVYRVWDGAKSYTEFGRWWSFSPPQGPRESYREENEICPTWSALDRLSACMLKVGALIVIGPGQSAKCDGTSYGKSAENQVYVPNDSKNGKVYVENCISSEKWPNTSP